MDFKINPGEFRHPITIQKSTVIKNGDGIPKCIWNDLLNTRAKVINVHGDEYYKALSTGVKIEKTFYIRFDRSKNITENDRVIYNNEIYDIKYVNDIKDMNIYLEIKGEKL